MRRPFFGLAIVLSLLPLAFACDGEEKAPTTAGTLPTGSTPGTAGAEASRDGGSATLVDGAVGVDGEPSDASEPVGPPAVQLLGRFDTRDPAGPKCAWPGCRIVARFDGTGVSARFTEALEPWMLGGPSEFDVAIDGVWQPKIVMPPGGTQTYVLAQGLSPGKHTVELYKRSEAQNGVTQFLGYDFGGGTLLAPPPRAARRIEIIGDSAPAAFGVEGVGQGPDCPGEDHAAVWQNFRRSLGARLGEGLGAEVNGTVYSGKGVAKNIWHPDTETMPILFPRSLPNDKSSTWDFSLFTPDVAVIMMGGNDFAVGKPVDQGPATLAQFVEAYDGFVVTLRQLYPAAHLFLVTSPSVTDAEPAGRNTRTNVLTGIQQVVERRNGAGDAKVYAVTPPVAQKTELTGCNGHGSPELHQRVADDLTPLIRAKTGW